MDGTTTQEKAQSRIHRMRWWTLAVVSVTVLLATIDETILSMALPSLQRDLGASASSLLWMVNSYLLVFGGLLLTMGGVGDRFGRARMLRYGLAVFALSSLGAALAQSSAQLIGARAIMGMGGAMMMPATLAVIVIVFEEKERPKAIAIWAMMAGIGVALGPVLGGTLLTYFYWGSVFLVNVPIAGVAIVASLFLVPDSRDPRSRPLDIPGALLSMGTVSALILAIIEGPNWGIGSPRLAATVATAVVLGLGFVIRERQAAYPLLDFALFRLPRFTTGAVAISLAFFSITGFIFGFTQYLQFVQGYSPLAAGIRFLPIAGGFMFGAIASEELVRRFGTTRVVAAGLVIMTATMPFVLLWETNTSYLVVGPIVAVIALRISLVFAPAAEAVMGAVGAAKAGVGSAHERRDPDAGGRVQYRRSRISDVCDLRRQARGRYRIAAGRSGTGSTRFNRGGSSAGGVAAARGRARPSHRGEVGFLGCAGSSDVDRRRVLGRRGTDRCQVHAGARH